MSLLQTIKDIFARSKPPLGRTTPGVALGEPPSVAQSISAERLAGMLRQAEAGDPTDLFSLYREIRLGHAHTQNLINQRKLNVLTKALNITPADNARPEDVRAAEAAKELVKVPGWLNVAMNHLLNGHLYPVAVLEQIYAAAPANAQGLLYVPVEWAPVPYHLLDYTDGRLRLWEADQSTGHRLGGRCDLHPVRHVVHRGHLLTDIPDNWGGPLRAAVFWWLFAVMDRDWWVRFLDRFGAPFLVGRYDTADTKSRSVLVNAFSAAQRLFGIVVSKETQIEVKDVAASSHGEAYEKMQNFANGELSKLILGQTMTVSAAPGGIGGTQAQVQENVQGSIEAWDLTALAETVNAQIIAPFLRLNGITGRAVMQVATDTASDLTNATAYLEAAAKAGLEATDEAVEILNNKSGIPLRRAGSQALPGTTPSAAVPGVPAKATESVQSQAMNGAQVQSLVQVIEAVAAKSLPTAAAMEVLKNAFPAVPEESLQRMLASASSAIPPTALAARPDPDGAAALAQAGQPTNEQLDSIAAAGAASLAEAFTGRYAPVRQMIEESTSAADLEHRLHVFFAGLPAGRVQGLVEDALIAYGANGAAGARVLP